MKITIPEEYRDRFAGERAWIKPKDGGECIVQDLTPAFVMRWKGHGLLVTNSEVFSDMKRRIEALQKKSKKRRDIYADAPCWLRSVDD